MSSTLEAHVSNVSNRLNDVMKVLAVLTGMFGMHAKFSGFPGRPKAQLRRTVGVMLPIGGSMLLWFGKRGWL